MIGTFGCRQCVERLDRSPDWASESRSGIPKFEFVAPYMAVGGMMILGNRGCLADELVEIGSTVATADSIALESVSVQNWE